MKRAIFLTITLSLIINPLWAQDITNRLGIGARFMWLAPKKETHFDNLIQMQSGKLEGKSMFGGTLTYGVSRWLSLEVAFDNSLNTDLNDKVLDIKIATVRVYPLTFSAQLRYIAPPEYYTWMVPYLTFGFGRYFISCNTSKEYKEHEAPKPPVVRDIKVDMDSTWGGHIGGGMDIFLSKNIALTFEFRYFWADSDIHERIILRSNDTIIYQERRSDRIDLDSWMVGAGIKFYFGLFGR